MEATGSLATRASSRTAGWCGAGAARRWRSARRRSPTWRARSASRCSQLNKYSIYNSVIIISKLTMCRQITRVPIDQSRGKKKVTKARRNYLTIVAIIITVFDFLVPQLITQTAPSVSPNVTILRCAQPNMLGTS